MLPELEIESYIPEHPVGWERTVAHMWEITFKPELEKRFALGTIESSFRVYMAQLLQTPEGESSVLFNEEVKGHALLRAPRDIEMGEKVYWSDLEHVEKFDLPDDLMDCGHFTMILSGSKWFVAFNFLSGRAKAKDMLNLASEFLEASQTSAAKGHAGPAVDNLFSASELVSKAELILHRNKAASAKKHGAVASAINNWARLGNIDQAFVDLFNRLSQQRPNSRYGDRENRPQAPDAGSFEIVSAMIERGLQIVAWATDLPSNSEKSANEASQPEAASKR